MPERSLVESLVNESSAREMFEKFLERSEISAGDFLLIRDLCEYCGTKDLELQGLLLILCEAINAGSLCINLKSPAIQQRLNDFSLNLQKIYEAVNGPWMEIISHAPETDKPLVLAGDLLYFQKYYKAERLLSSQFENLVEWQPQCSENVKSVLEEVLNTLPFKLHPLQVQGVIVALLNNFSIISGGPGTGKTSIVVALLRCLVRLKKVPIDKIKMVAPTGRAAQRMTESVRSSLDSLSSILESDRKVYQVEASTIHRLLQLQPGRSSLFEGKNKLNIDVLIVDEVSMVDALLMARMMNALPENCKIVFLGDKHQLPSVDAGSVLTDLVPLQEGGFSADFKASVHEIVPSEWSGLVANMKIVEKRSKLTDRITHLNHSYRSEKSILEFSQSVNLFDEKELNKICDDKSLLIKSGASNQADLDMPLFSNFEVVEDKQILFPKVRQTEEGPKSERGGVHFNWHKRYEDNNFDEFLRAWFNEVYSTPYLKDDSYENQLRRVTQTLIFEDLNVAESSSCLKSLFKAASSSRVLCFTKMSHTGVDAVNTAAVEYLRHRTDPHSETQLFHGCLVLITRNDYSRQLFNGDVGITLKNGDDYFVVFERQGQFISFPADSLHGHEYAFAITVHKSQGSEYERVLMLLPEAEENRLLAREILYTGITRAKYLAVICGRKDIFMKAAACKIQRVSGLDLWD